MKRYFLDKFQARSFLYQGTLCQKNQAAVSCKLVSYMLVLYCSLLNRLLEKFLWALINFNLKSSLP